MSTRAYADLLERIRNGDPPGWETVVQVCAFARRTPRDLLADILDVLPTTSPQNQSCAICRGALSKRSSRTTKTKRITYLSCAQSHRPFVRLEESLK